MAVSIAKYRNLIAGTLKYAGFFTGSIPAPLSGVMSRITLPILILALVAGCSTSDEFPTQNPAAQVELPIGYRIDRTEVTRDQYASWLASRPELTAQPVVCAWNTSFAPDTECLEVFKDAVCEGPDCQDHPQVCVDWCDARAYCEGVGKRLCGRIGGGPTPFEAYADPGASQWYAACSASGWKEYPFGRGATACNTVDLGLGTTTPVGSLPDCQPGMEGYQGVMDLGGNAWEWEDSCQSDTGDDDYCHVRGGSFNSAEETLACADAHAYPRSMKSFYVGFRCCSE